MPPQDDRRVRGPRRGGRQRSRRTWTGAQKVLDDLEAAGIDYDDVVETLEQEGVKKFADSFKELFSDIESKRDQLVAA